MTAPPPAVSVSVVIEWENAARIGGARARRMLRALRSELARVRPRLWGSIEVILVHDEGEVPQAEIRSSLGEEAAGWEAELVYLAVPTGEYYAQKNWGARRARGELIAFLDSDVLPQPGWLEALLAPLQRGEAELVGGLTTVERSTLYSKAMAAGWIFPLPGDGERIAEASHFFANNFAAPARILAAHPFPEAGLFRGQCGMLARQLVAAGHRVLRNPDARVLHPPPEPGRPFVLRALRSGHDGAQRFRRPHGPGLLRGARAMLGDVLRSQLRVLLRRREAGIGPLSLAPACAVIGAYHLLRLAGFAFAASAPGAAARALLGRPSPALKARACVREIPSPHG